MTSCEYNIQGENMTNLPLQNENKLVPDLPGDTDTLGLDDKHGRRPNSPNELTTLQRWKSETLLEMSKMVLSRRMLLHPSFREIHKLSCRHFSDFIPKDKWAAVRKREVKRFIVDCMTKVGTKELHAKSLASNLVMADYRGHYSHGLNRLGKY